MALQKMKFTEFDGMVLLQSLSSAQEAAKRRQEKGADLSRWQYERGANHIHARMSVVDREHVRQEMRIASDFEAALRHAYPERDFVICHIPCYAVSFYQLIDDAPTEYVPPPSPVGETAWCQNCQCGREYRLLPEPDEEFPWLKWAACVVCSNDIVLNDGEFRTVIKGSRSSLCAAECS